MESSTDRSFVSFTTFVSECLANFYRNRRLRYTVTLQRRRAFEQRSNVYLTSDDFNSHVDQFDELLLEPAGCLSIAKDSNQPGRKIPPRKLCLWLAIKRITRSISMRKNVFLPRHTPARRSTNARFRAARLGSASIWLICR